MQNGPDTTQKSAQTTTALKNSSTTQNSNTTPSLKQQQDPSSSSANDINPEDICSPHELIGWVDNVLEKLEAKFSGVETEVLQRLDALGKRIDSLELSMSSLLEVASNPNPPPNQPIEASPSSTKPS